MPNKLSNMHNGFVLKLKYAQYDKLVKIQEAEGLSLSGQIRFAISDYLKKRGE